MTFNSIGKKNFLKFINFENSNNNNQRSLWLGKRSRKLIKLLKSINTRVNKIIPVRKYKNSKLSSAAANLIY